MTSPLKPWERSANSNSRSFNAPGRQTGTPSVRFRIPSGTSKSNEMEQQRNNKSPPPIPSRQGNNTYGQSYNQGYGGSSMYGSGYGNYYGSYGGYGGYGMGSYYPSYGMNRGIGYGASNMPQSTFARTAEESCQPAFQSVQSIVQAFASIAQVLDSTFFAVHSSFRAVIGVADQFTSLRNHIANTLGGLAIFRGIRYVFRMLMRFFRLRRSDSDQDDLWSDFSQEVASKSAKKSPKSWPIFLFFAVVLGTPWLIWKFLQSISSDETSESWMTGESDHFEAQAEYDFDAANSDELSIQAGDLLRIAPKHKQPRVRGYLLATVDGNTTGLVPYNHIKIFGQRKKSRERVEEDANKESVSVGSEKAADENRTNTKITEIYDEEIDEQDNLDDIPFNEE